MASGVLVQVVGYKTDAKNDEGQGGGHEDACKIQVRSRPIFLTFCKRFLYIRNITINSVWINTSGKWKHLLNVYPSQKYRGWPLYRGEMQNTMVCWPTGGAVARMVGGWLDLSQGWPCHALMLQQHLSELTDVKKQKHVSDHQLLEYIPATNDLPV